MDLNNIVGNLIIAPPSVKGNIWYKTVIMIVEHLSHGSIGMIINKKSDITINELGNRLGIDIDIPGFIYNGGPVNQNSISLIHTNDWSCSNTLRINDTFSISSAKDVLERLAKNDCPCQWRLFYGMCGWAPNQLLSEIKGTPPYSHDTSWCTTSSDLNLVFNKDNKEQWISSLNKSAEDFAKSIDLIVSI